MTGDKFALNWQNIDQTKAADQHSSYLEEVARLAQVYKQQSFDLLRPDLGHQILDVGCGNGDDVRALAHRVGSDGSVIGIDPSQDLIAKAQGHPGNTRLPCTFQVGDAYHLPFEDNRFNGCRSDRVFQHLSDRDHALTEMIRVTRTAGWIVVSDPDWETLVVDVPGNEPLTRKIINYLTDHGSVNRWAGRQLYRLLNQIGLVEIGSSAHTLILTEFSVADRIFGISACVQAMVEDSELSAEDAAGWLGTLQQANEHGCFYSAMTGFTVCGKKA